MSALSFLRSTVKHVAKRAEKTSASVAVRHIGSSSSIGDPETAYLNRLLREKRAESASAQSLMTKQRHMAVDYSFASPFADFAAPTSLELMESEIMDQLREREREQQARVQALLQRLSPPKQPAFSHAVSFASPESDAAGPIALELTAADQRAALAETFPTTLSFATPFADAVGHHPADASVWAPAVGAPLHPPTLSFSSPESDFTAPQPDEVAWATQAAAAFDHPNALSFSSPESDFCAVHVAAAAKPALRVSISRAD